ncbi:Set1/Ash2 histone methyltransferase complex subunit ASH2 [Maudiozyma exigua]|uniref:Set1/Ash2 histone methyltransferase complex subunit ASH2 n=1 Tax=Maudiozyma exigua TaxID=34358 RepID=A0A9P6WB14_MAUEX|nr:Set1/Ash2 histone methyltransferase complex subunit ASH2 [Kazachstania exigua]
MITEENNNNNNNNNSTNVNTVLTDIKEETIDFDTSLTDEDDSNDNDDEHNITIDRKQNHIDGDDDQEDNKTIQHSTMIIMSSESSSNNSSVIIHQQNIDNNNNNNMDEDMDITNNDDSMNKSLKDGEISIPLSTSSITVDKFVSNEELALLPPLPNALDLQLDTQNLTGSLTNSSSNNDNNNNNNNNSTLQNNNNITSSTTIGTDSYTPVSLIDPSSLTANSTPDTELKNLMLLTQDIDNNNTTTTNSSPNNNNNNSDSRIPHTMINLSQGSPILLTPLSEDNISSSPTDFNNAINTSFDLSKAFEMSSSSTPNATTDNTTSNTNSNGNNVPEFNTTKKITNVFQEHKKVKSSSSLTLSHKSSSILTKRVSNKSITPIDQDQQQQPLNFLKNEEKLYQISNVNNHSETTTTSIPIPQEKQIDLSADVYIPYVSDSLSGLGVSDLTPLSTQSIINQNSLSVQNSIITPSTPVPTKKIPFLRRASSTLLRKASMKSLSRQESNSIQTPRSSGTTPIMASPSQFDNNNLIRTRSSSVLQESNTSRRKPTMKRNVSFGSKMKRSISRIVSNSISNSTENLNNTPATTTSTNTGATSDRNANTTTPTNSIQPQLNNTQTQYSSSHIQSPLEVIRHTHSYTPTSTSSNNERLYRTSTTNQIRVRHAHTTSKDSSLNSDRKHRHYHQQSASTNPKYIELDTTVLRDNKLLPATNITDQISNDSKTLDKIIQQSKLSLLPSSYGSNSLQTNSTPSLGSSNSNKQDIKLEKLSLKEYLQLLKSLKIEEINQYDTIINNLQIHGWYSDQEINNMIKKKDLLKKLWNDRISFYQNQI